MVLLYSEDVTVNQFVTMNPFADIGRLKFTLENLFEAAMISRLAKELHLQGAAGEEKSWHGLRITRRANLVEIPSSARRKNRMRKLGTFLLIVVTVLGASGVGWAQNVDSTSESATTDSMGAWRFGYVLGNSLGSSTFIGRPQLRQTVQISTSYGLTDLETVSATLGGRGEFFTRTNSSMDRLFASDSVLSIRTSRIPTLELSELGDIRFSSDLSHSLPLSSASRKVTGNWGTTSVSGTASHSLGGVSTSISTSLNYTFYRYTHLRFENKEAGDRTQEGYTLFPLNLGLNVAMGYSFGELGTRITYGFFKSRSFENNAGNAYWRDIASFSLAAFYSLTSYLTLSGGYQYGADPLDGQGEIRNPFWSFYADYNNRSRIFLNLSGAIAPF